MSEQGLRKKALFAFSFDFNNGRVFWRTPPKNHSERRGMEAGSLNKAKGKNKDYWLICLDEKIYKRGRLIFLVKYGRWPYPVLDHINGNSLDDRLCNLRECSRTQNNLNIDVAQGKRELPRGVSITAQGRYMARLNSKSLGVYSTKEEAESVYKSAKAEVLHDTR